MTAPSHLGLADRQVSRRRLRRVSRQFATVGVDVSPERLRHIASGGPASEAERFDIAFAEVALHIKGDHRRSRRSRAQWFCVRSVIVSSAVVVALNVLIGLGLAFFLMAEHRSPF